VTTSDSRAFGEALGEALGNGPPRAALSLQRQNLVAMMEARTRPRFFRFLVPAFGLAAVAALVVFVLVRAPAPAAELSASFAGKPVVPHTLLDAAEDRSRTLEFSDGSSVVLAPKARAVLGRITREQAGLSLEGGQLYASIQHREGLHWSVDAGPYRVNVVGTRFSVAWNAGKFRVDVTEGRVRVTGGDLPPEGVAVDAGNGLERQVKQAPAEAPAVDREALPVEKPAPETAEREAPSPSAPSWSALANKGKYRDALAQAEKLGFDRLTRELSDNDLLLLANAARFSGDRKRAKQALLKLRERFPGRAAAELAALYLARLAEDVEKNPAQAVVWLRAFLQESPTGDLAQGARANLLAILLRRGDQAGARAVARDYLRYHPEGPHAAQARSLERGSPSP
jgi:hypothetical protein